MKFKNIIAILFLIPLFAFAQGGSNYSGIGLGNINYYGTSAYAGMGGTNIATPIENGINLRNPAMWSQATNSRLQLGYRFTQNYISNEENSLFQNNGNFSGFTTLFSIDTSLGISASLGLVPYSRVNYFTASQFSITEDDITVDGKTEYQGRGGINSFYLGASTKIIENLYVGGSAFILFGNLQSQVDNLVFGNVSNFAFDTRVLSEAYLTGVGFKTGLYYELPKGFSVGAFYERAGNVSVEDSTLYYRPSSIGISEYETSSFDIEIPDMYGIGASLKTGKFLLAADFAMQDFSNFTFKPGANTTFDNSMYINVGVMRFGNKDFSADFADKITYKFGASYKDLYYRILDEDINDLSLSLGMAIPVPRTMVFDVGLTFGMRGTTSNGLVREYYGQLNIDVSIGELWFKPFKREFD
jgi:hypothetical protein